MEGVALTGASSGVSAKTTIDHCRRDGWSPTNWCPRTLETSQLAKFNKKKLTTMHQNSERTPHQLCCVGTNTKKDIFAPPLRGRTGFKMRHWPSSARPTNGTEALQTHLHPSDRGVLLQDGRCGENV